MADFDTSNPYRPKGLLQRLMRFLGLGYSAEDEYVYERLAALDLNTTVYADLFFNKTDEFETQ